MKRLIPFLVLGLALSSCSEESDDTSYQAPVAKSFSELTVPSDFNWSSSQKGKIKVNLVEHTESPINLNGGFLWIMDSNGERIALDKINNATANFDLVLPANQQGYSFFLPATGETWALEMRNQVSLQLRNPFDTANLINEGNSGKNAGVQQTSFKTGTNIIGNGDFEINPTNQNEGFVATPSASTLDDGEWHIYDKDWKWSDQNGSKVFKAKNNKQTDLWQFHTVTPGDSLYITADQDGYAYLYAVFFSSVNASSHSSYVYKSSSSNLDISTVVPAGMNVVKVHYYLDKKTWIDNVFLSNPVAISDADGDGVADGDDDFPNDPTRAYLSHYPSSGNVTVAFEDFWPLQGDYDFNDMVVNMQVDLIKDANNKWVSADYTLALDAFGAGIESGLALQLLNSNNQVMSNIISSISGDASLDPDVTNGIIVFSDPDELRNGYYTNTSPSLMATPDTARFTLNFASSNNGEALSQDMYIFHTLERGREIHLPGYTGTSEADASLNNTGDDVNGTYKTVTGLPWAMEVVLSAGTKFNHPLEKVDMITAYPDFSPWAASSGSTNQNWFDNPTIGNTIDLSQF